MGSPSVPTKSSLTNAETNAVNGQLSDVGSTAAAITLGAGEANPLVLALLPAKFALLN